VAGAFEELPSIMVVLVAVSLFCVSVAHASSARSEARDYEALGEDCLAFAGMVRDSEALCGDGCGILNLCRLQNVSEEDFLGEFNSTALGFGYRVSVQCLDIGTGNVTLERVFSTGERPEGSDTATFSTCAGLDCGGRTGAARLSVSVWRLDQ